MTGYRQHVRNASWITFAIAIVVYYFSVERVGSLWDVGEFVLGAHKLQVVHPPGAPLFLIIGRLFGWVAELFTDDPSVIAWSINFSSALCTAFAALFIAQITGILGKYALVGGDLRARRSAAYDKVLVDEEIPDDRDVETTQAEGIALGLASLVSGLVMAFATSIWFSAVEGEVYAMSTLFTAMTFWAMVRWYDLPDTARSDRWIVFAVFATGLSVGVHLLSLLTFPALAMFYFYKKYPAGVPAMTKLGAAVAGVITLLAGIVALVALLEGSVFSTLFFGGAAVGFGLLAMRSFGGSPSLATSRAAGGLGAAIGGLVALTFAQAAVIKGIPALWAQAEVVMVNGLGLPFHSGLIPVTLLLGGLIGGGFYAAVKYRSRALELLSMSVLMLVIGFSVVGVVVIRANASPPINMNVPGDAMRLQYYLNREQYGDRPLVRGPHFEARPTDYESSDRYGRVGDRYEVVDEKLNPVYRESDKMLFPRMADPSQGRPQIYRSYWMGGKQGPITMGDNLGFFVRYQLDWMYWRYFMWNFSGRQNHEQGFFDNDPRSGNWITGIDFVDEMILGVELDELPPEDRQDEGRNEYYAIPFLLGLAGAFFHLRRRPADFLGVLALYTITGIGIILYTNQPPNEPRERDYVQAGAVFTYCIWVGMGVLAIFSLLRHRIGNQVATAGIAGAIALVAPALMAFQGFDDHSRMEHEASRDYATNFLNSLAPDAVIFTYGDNDTYPLWYAQEVEGVRTDVRVGNLSLIAIDWYIDLLRRRINDSPALNFTLDSESLRGQLRNQIPVREGRPLPLKQALAYANEPHPVPLQGGREVATDFPTSQPFIPVDPAAARAAGVVDDLPDSAQLSRVDIDLGGRNWLLKDDLAVLDILASNLWERPIYFATTVLESKMLGLQPYLRLEGLALRVTPYRAEGRATIPGPTGAGRVDVERVYENFTEKFAFGRFDELDLFVDPSYNASVQSTQFLLVRTMQELLAQGDRARAGELAVEFFDKYPPFNFRLNFNSIFPLQVLVETGRIEEAKPLIREFADVLGERMEFLESQDARLLEPRLPLGTELQQTEGAREALRRLAQSLGDPEFQAEVEGEMGVPAS